MLAYDEAHKSVVSATQLVEGLGQTFSTPAGTNLSNQITAPVLVVNGQFDLFSCEGPNLDCNNPAAVQAFEAPFYTSSPSLTTVMVPNTGHDLVLHTTTAISFEIINGWLNTPLPFAFVPPPE